MKNMLILIFILSFNKMFAQAIYQFEDNSIKYIETKNSVVSISTNHSIDGDHSLKWDFEPSGELEITGFKLPTVNWYDFFAINIYNEEPMEDKKIVFRLGNARTFYMNLNFKGWRTIWINHFNDMKGSSGPVDQLTIEAPQKSGTLYIDQIVPYFKPQNRLAYGGDIHVPYVHTAINQTPAEFNWYAKLRYYNRLDFSEPEILYSDEEVKSINTITKRLEELFSPPKQVVTQSTIQELKKQLDFLKTRRISMAKPYTSMSWITNEEALNYLKDTQFHDVGIFLRKIAYAYHFSVDKDNKAILLNYYLKMIDYLNYQGWNTGSGMGSNSHIGYSIREFAESVFFMREGLKERNRLDEIQKMLAWYINLGGIIDFHPREIVGVNMDLLNTLSSGMLIAILIIDNVHIKIDMLYSYKEYFNQSLSSSVGLTGGYKEDGSGYHHRMHYPGYGDPALAGFGPVLYSLSKTPFAINPQNHCLMKKYLLMSRVAANKNHIMLLTSGRHPNGKTVLPEESFRYFALSGTPDQNNDIDKEVAAAYLRLFPDGEKAQFFTELGIQAEANPNGTWTMNRASLQLHRRNDWLTGARGFSRYLVGTEIYRNDNRYGRYFGYGQFQYMKKDMTNSGFVMEGFDWNHFPGTTSVYLPLEKLESIILGTEMLLQVETFSGGNTLDNHGLFSMKLRENSRYDGSHTARKSIFFLDNRIVFLGSDINNTNTNSTHTTVFQNYLGDKSSSIVVTNNGIVIIDDSVSNTYYIPVKDNQEIIYKSGMQLSRHEKTRTVESNNYETSYINHGEEPQDTSYYYYALIQGTPEEKVVLSTNQQFVICQQDNDAHILYDVKNQMKHYVLFESKTIRDELVIGSSHPSTIIVKYTGDNLKMSYVNPDLAMYHGVSQESANIYSAKWGDQPVIPVRNFIDIRGVWYSDNPDVKMTYIGNRTTLQLTTVGGKPVLFTLYPNKELMAQNTNR